MSYDQRRKEDIGFTRTLKYISMAKPKHYVFNVWEYLRTHNNEYEK